MYRGENSSFLLPLKREMSNLLEDFFRAVGVLYLGHFSDKTLPSIPELIEFLKQDFRCDILLHQPEH